MIAHNCREAHSQDDLHLYRYPQVNALVTTNNFK